MLQRPAQLYTAGYEGKSVGPFFQTLLDWGVRQIVDVRRNAISRKYGFSKSSLIAVATEFGLAYVHLPELGIPTAERRTLSGIDDYRDLFDRYERRLLSAKPDPLAPLIQILRRSTSVLVCFEEDPAYCHRSHLARLVATRTGLKVKHLA